jgi:hypothetical protein
MQHLQLSWPLKEKSLGAGNSRFVQLLQQFVSTRIALFITPRGLTFYWQLVVSKPGIQMSNFDSVVSGIRFLLSPRHATVGEKMEVRDLGQCCPSGDELLPLHTVTRTQWPFVPAASQIGNLSLICWQTTGMHYFCFAQFEWRSGLRPGILRPSVNCFDLPRIKKRLGAESKASAHRICWNSGLSGRCLIFRACCILLVSPDKREGSDRTVSEVTKQQYRSNKSVLLTG